MVLYFRMTGTPPPFCFKSIETKEKELEQVILKYFDLYFFDKIMPMVSLWFVSLLESQLLRQEIWGALSFLRLGRKE